MIFPHALSSVAVLGKLVDWGLTPHEKFVWSLILGTLFALGAQAMICALLYESVANLPVGNRRMSPASVWLLMIPGLNLVLNFLIFPRVAAACTRQLRPETAGTTQALAVLAAVGTLLAVALLGLLAFDLVQSSWFFSLAISGSVAGLILLSIFLITLNRLKNL